MFKRYIALSILILGAFACNWSNIAPPAAPVIEPSSLPTFAISTLTPLPTEPPLPTPTSTPDSPIAWPKDLGVNCRYGPGEEWEAISSLPAETTTQIKGRTINTSWWYVVDVMNPEGFCWVAYDVVDTAGNLNIVPIGELPVASVTSVKVDALVTFSACGEDNPVTFKGEITTNGPTMVMYHWEVSGDVQVSTPQETIQFAKSRTRNVTADFFAGDCGSYTARLLVTGPNTESAEKIFTIQAP
jgi:hypothetical protein